MDTLQPESFETSTLPKHDMNRERGNSMLRLSGLRQYKRIVQAIIAVVFLVIFIVLITTSAFRGEGFYNPTVSVTMYYRSSSPDAHRVLPEWSIFVRNAQTDGKFIVYAVDCDDSTNAQICKGVGNLPLIIKQQAGGQTRIFAGTNSASSYYHFANTDY